MTKIVKQIKGLYNRKKLIKNDPLIDKKPFFNRFKFVLYLSVQSTNDIHEITAYQLQQLSKNNLMEVFLRANDFDNFAKTYPSIKKIDKRFDHYIPTIAK